jgi:hypothetical protein
MGTLIASAQATLDGVIHPVGEWVQPDGDHGDHSFERKARSGGMVLGRKSYAEKGLIHEYEVYLTRSSGAREKSLCSATGGRYGCRFTT